MLETLFITLPVLLLYFLLTYTDRSQLGALALVPGAVAGGTDPLPASELRVERGFCHSVTADRTNLAGL